MGHDWKSHPAFLQEGLLSLTIPKPFCAVEMPLPPWCSGLSDRILFSLLQAPRGESPFHRSITDPLKPSEAFLQNGLYLLISGERQLARMHNKILQRRAELPLRVIPGERIPLVCTPQEVTSSGGWEEEAPLLLLPEFCDSLFQLIKWSYALRLGDFWFSWTLSKAG